MHLVLTLAATLAIAGIQDNRWELPCASPQELLMQGEDDVGPEWTSTAELHSVSTLRMRRPPRRAASRQHSHYAPKAQDPETANRNRLMHWFGLADVDSDRRLGLGFHFERVKNFTLHLKLVDNKPAVGVGYYTRY